VTVALVLIPQSLAYAALAGLPPYVGLYASAFPLLAFAIFSSSPYLQTGPVALTSLLTLGVLQGAGFEAEASEYIAAAALLAVIVGVTRLLVGVFRFGSVVYLMAEPVMIGFTSAAGIVILSSQLPRALGVTLPADVADLGNPLARGAWAVVHPGDWEFAAVVISVITVTLMVKGKSIHRLFPGVLIAVVLVLAWSTITDYGGPIVGEIESGFPPVSLDLPWSSASGLVVGGIVIALVGFAEPASIARTFANDDQSQWSSSREFFASGLANVVAGVTGAFPVGGSFSRSSVNRFAGATTRWSGAITGAVVLLFLPFSGLLEKLPQALLGAIVVAAVFSLIKPRRMVNLWTRSPWQAGLAWFTFVATLLTPPNVQFAVLIGVALTVVFHLVRPFHLEVEEDETGAMLIRPRGLLWVASNTKLKNELRRTIGGDDGTGPIVLNLDRSTAIDSGIADSVAGGRAAADKKGRSFTVVNPPEGAAALLENFGVAVDA
jgi:SulP family sulfate permease